MVSGEKEVSMTKLEKLNTLIKTGKQADGVLFHPILMHFAARFHKTTYSEFASKYKVLVEANVACLGFFCHDAVSVISDPYRETSAFGAKIIFPEDSVPICKEHLVQTLEDVKTLRNPDVLKAERTRDRIEGVRYYRQLLGDTVPIIGWVEGPLAEACDLAGAQTILLNMALDPDFVSRLMEKCMVTAKDFARAQIEAGSTVMGVGDAICSQISRDMYREFIFPLHQELFEYIHSQGALIKLHICGNIAHLLPELKKLPIDILDIDWMVDMSEASKILDNTVIVCGNLNPVAEIQNLSADALFEKSRGLVERMRGRRFILSGGCEITVGTPHENLKRMKEAADFGKVGI